MNNSSFSKEKESNKVHSVKNTVYRGIANMVFANSNILISAKMAMKMNFSKIIQERYNSFKTTKTKT